MATVRTISRGLKRIRLGFIEGARGRPEIFAKRLGYFVRMTAQGKRFGMMRS